MQNLIGVYCIRNSVNGKFYIGSSRNLKARWICGHRVQLRNGNHSNPYLQHAWNKYGEQAFEFKILEECSVEEQLIREQQWIDYSNCLDRSVGYNIVPKVSRPPSNLGKKHSIETVRKISEGNKGSRNGMYGRTGSLSPCFRKIVSAETREKLAIAHRGKIVTDEFRQKCSLASRGRSWNRKLEANQVIEIREKVASGIWDRKQVLQLFGIGASQYYRILRGDTWKYLF